MPTERVLVVDDDPAILMLCHRILEADGYHVSDAKRGEDALARLESDSFDLLLTDIRLPGLNGLDVTQRLRERNSELTVVTMTGYSNMDMAIQALSLGVDEFIIKPFTPDSLRFHVSRALEKSRLRRENLKLRTLLPLLETAQAFAGGRTREQVYHDLFTALSSLLKSGELFMLSVPPDSQFIAVTAARGQVFGGLLDQRVDATEWQREIEFFGSVPRVWDEREHPRLPFAVPEVGWIIGSTVQTGGEILAILYVAVAQPPIPADMEALALITTQAALALQNVDLLIRLSLAYQSVREVEEIKTEFVNIAAHELRTPLSILRGYAGLLQNAVAGDPHAYVVQIIDCADRLQQIADDLLNLKYLEVGQVDLNLEPCEVGQVVSQVVDSYRQLAAEREQEIELKVQAATAGQVKADRAMLNSMLGSLVANAIKFSPRKTRVQVGAQGDAQHVTMVVKDQGKGLTPDQVEHVFDAFYQASSSLTRQEGGMGLGLTLAHKMVNAHGGKIWVESELNHGSAFYISLPRNTAAPE